MVVELQAHPVPTRLFRGELVSEEFVIHPGQAGNEKRFGIHSYGAGRGQTR